MICEWYIGGRIGALEAGSLPNRPGKYYGTHTNTHAHSTSIEFKTLCDSGGDRECTQRMTEVAASDCAHRGVDGAVLWTVVHPASVMLRRRCSFCYDCSSWIAM